MTSDYRIGLGHGLSYDDLELIVPQPRSDGVIVAQRNFGADGRAHDRGLWIPLSWSVLGSLTLLHNVLDQFDLEDDNRQAVTGNFPDFEGIYHVYQGWALRPIAGSSISRAIFVKNLRIVVNRLERIG